MMESRRLIQWGLVLEAQNGIIEVNETAPEGWNENQRVSVQIECNYIKKGDINKGTKDKMMKKREKLVFSTEVNNGKVEFSVPVPHSWNPLLKDKGCSIDAKFICPNAQEIIYEKDTPEEDKGYCPLCGKPVDLDFIICEDMGNNIFRNIHSIHCYKCDRKLRIVEETEKPE